MGQGQDPANAKYDFEFIRTDVVSSARAWVRTAAGPPAASELGQLGAWRRDPHPPRTEIDDQGGVILDADDPAEAVLIVCHLVAHGELLGRRSEGRRAEGTCRQEGPGTGTFHYHQYAPLALAGSPGLLAGDGPPGEPRAGWAMTPLQRFGDPLPATRLVVHRMHQESSRRVG